MSIALLEAVAASALTGAKDSLAADIEFDNGEPIVVVTVAWHSADGHPFAIASAIPGHSHELLASSLHQSAEEASEAQQYPETPNQGGSDEH